MRNNNIHCYSWSVEESVSYQCLSPFHSLIDPFHRATASPQVDCISLIGLLYTAYHLLFVWFSLPLHVCQHVDGTSDMLVVFCFNSDSLEPHWLRSSLQICRYTYLCLGQNSFENILSIVDARKTLCHQSIIMIHCTSCDAQASKANPNLSHIVVCIKSASSDIHR